MPLFTLSQYCCFECMESDITRKMNGLFNYKLVSSTSPLPKTLLPEDTKIETIHITERRLTRSSSSGLNMPSPSFFNKRNNNNRMIERGINSGIDHRTREKVRENLFNGLKIVNENEKTKTDEISYFYFIFYIYIYFSLIYILPFVEEFGKEYGRSII